MNGDTSAENSLITLNKAINNYNLLQLRLDPTNLLNEVKMFLKAEIEVIRENPDGSPRIEFIRIGMPKANEHGIASILNWIQMTVNPHVVQGNFPMDGKGHSEMYDSYIYEFQMDLGDMIYINLYNYGIEEDEAQPIIDAIMNLIKAFMTRPIGNKERESYGDTFREVRTSSPQNNGGLPQIFKSN